VCEVRLPPLPFLSPFDDVMMLTAIGQTTFNTSSVFYTTTTLWTEHQAAIASYDLPRQMRAVEHMATVNGRYNFSRPGNLNQVFEDHEMTAFEDFLHHHWDGEPLEDDD
jgi:hypothetical protein